MKIVLVRAPFIEVFTGMPIGLAYIQHALKPQHDVEVLDFSFDVNNHFQFSCGQFTRDFTLREKHPAVKYAYNQLDRYCNIILARKPNVVGFHLSYSTVDYSLAMAARLRAKGIRVIAGGPEATYRSTLLIKSFDSVVCGYGEEAVHQALVHDGVFEKELDINKKYEPDYTGIDFSRYGGRYPLLTSRGCPHRCTFCSQHTKYYFHDLQLVANQLQRMPAGCSVLLNDSNFNAVPKRTKSALQCIGDNIGKRTMHGFGFEVSDKFDSYAEEYARCNFVEARIGIESGSEAVRQAMRKPNFTNSDVRKMVRQMTSCGSTVWAQFIFCYPSETDEDREKTLELMHQLIGENQSKKVRVYWFRFVVHHGTEEYFRKTYGVVPHTIKDWTSPMYTPQKVQELAEKYRSRLPSNAEIHL